MKRRGFLKSLFAAITAMFWAALGGLTFVGCDKKTIISWASTAASFLEQTLPYFQDLLPASVALLTKAVTVARQLKEALEKNSENAVEFIHQLIAPDGLFQKILLEVGLISNEQKRKIVSGILAIAGVALNIIAAALQQGTSPEIIESARSRNRRGVDSIEKIAKGKALEKALAALKN